MYSRKAEENNSSTFCVLRGRLYKMSIFDGLIMVGASGEPVLN